MNITKTDTGVPAKFDYEYFDENGELTSAEIKLRLHRLSFRKVSASAFQEAMSKINEHPEQIAQLLCDVIEDWNLFTDDAETEMFPINVDNIQEREPLFVAGLAEAVFERLFPNPL